MPLVLKPAVKSSLIETNQVKLLADTLKISRPLAEVLYTRGYKLPEEARAFLHPQTQEFFEPLLLTDMPQACELINKHIKNKSRIVVYGDYDVDGVCASAIVFLALKKAGAHINYYIPDRHQEGYGLNEMAMKAVAGKYDLLISVDCGISSYKEVELGKSLGMDIVITDHHSLPERLPDCVCVDPKRPGEQPYSELCGAGVAFKLVSALFGLEEGMEYIDLAAIATIADIVPLTGENRQIVREGLKRINSSPRAGLAALAQAAGVKTNGLSASDIAFTLAPRLNAAGRLESASRSLELLIEPELAEESAQLLNSLNIERQEIEKEIYQSAVQMAGTSGQIRDARIIILASQDWDKGVIGIVASRMVERFHRPCILFALEGDLATGSGRSVQGVNMFETLCHFSDYFIKFGGHEMAAGMTLKAELLEELSAALDEYIKENINPKCFYPSARYDARADISEITPRLCEELKLFEPFGMGNPTPKFRFDGLKPANIRIIGKNSNHLKASFCSDNTAIEGIAYSYLNSGVELNPDFDYTVIASPMLSRWNDITSAFLRLDAVSAELSEERLLYLIERDCDLIMRSFYSQFSLDGDGDESMEEEDFEQFCERLLEFLQDDISGTAVLCSHPDMCSRLVRFLRTHSPRTDISFYHSAGMTGGYNIFLIGVDYLKLNLDGYSSVFMAGAPACTARALSERFPYADFYLYTRAEGEKLKEGYNDISREHMGRAFKLLKHTCAQSALLLSREHLIMTAHSLDSGISAAFLAFALEVFLQLGFFIEETANDLTFIKISPNIKQAELSNSAIYNNAEQFFK